MKGYSVEIIDGSKEYKGREAISVKDLSNAVALDTELMDDKASVIITPKDYAVLKVNNEHSKNDKTYYKYVIIDNAGNKFVTGSESFFESFSQIMSEMREFPDEEFSISVYKKPSKNYQGKHFLTCSIVP